MKIKKIAIIIFVIIILCESAYISYDFFLKKNNNENNNTNSQEVLNDQKNQEDNLKYLVDITSRYKINSLKYKTINKNNYYYFEIDGLKKKDVQKKVNETIAKKITSIKSNDKEKIIASITSSFSNIISIEIYKDKESTSKDLKDYNAMNYAAYEAQMIDTLNLELVSGNEITINDIVTSKSKLKDYLTNTVEEASYYAIGFICSGGPCENPHPDFSKVEDNVLSIMNNYEKNNFKISIYETSISIYFDNTYYYIAYMSDEIEESAVNSITNKSCEIIEEEADEEDELIYAEEENDEEEYDDEYEDEKMEMCTGYLKDASFSLSYYRMKDFLTIYDKYKTKESIFENEKNESYLVLSDNNIDDIIVDGNTIIDYENVAYNNTEEIDKKLKELVIKEAKEMKTDGINLYRIAGVGTNLGPALHNYFNVTHYKLDKETYEKYKKQIFSDRFDRVNYSEIYEEDMDYSVYKRTEYDFLKNYKTKSNYYFYTYKDDEKFKEISIKDTLTFDLKYYDSIIPSEWLKNSKYKTTKQLFENAFVSFDENTKFKDRLTIYIPTASENIILKYNNLKKVLEYDENYDRIFKQED